MGADKDVADERVAPLCDEAKELFAGFVVGTISDAMKRILMLDALRVYKRPFYDRGTLCVLLRWGKTLTRARRDANAHGT